MTVERTGEGVFGNGTITLLLPIGDSRKLVVDGYESTPAEHDGRSGVRITVA
ncbi:hypothetical protein ACFSLT_23985 [Novosphingobium resinovorum]